MGSLRGRGSSEGRVQQRKKRQLRPWELGWRPSSTRRRKFEFGSEVGGERTDRKFILDCFQ